MGGEGRWHFDWESIIPPPVADDENFALAPVVASSYGEKLDASGHEKNPRDTNIVNRLNFDANAASAVNGRMMETGRSARQ